MQKKGNLHGKWRICDERCKVSGIIFSYMGHTAVFKSKNFCDIYKKNWVERKNLKA